MRTRIKWILKVRNERGAGTMFAILAVSAIFASAFVIMQSYIQGRIAAKQRTRQAIRALEVGEELVKLAYTAYGTANNMAYNYFDTCFNNGVGPCTLNTATGCQANTAPAGSPATTFGIGPTGLPGCWPAANSAPAQFCDPAGAGNLLTLFLSGARGPIGCFPNRSGPNDRCVPDPRGGAFADICIAGGEAFEHKDGLKFGEVMIAHWNGFVENAAETLLNLTGKNPVADTAIAAVVTSEAPPDFSAAPTHVQKNLQVVDCSAANPVNRPPFCEVCQKTAPDLTIPDAPNNRVQNCVQLRFGPGNAFMQTIKLSPNIRVPVTRDATTVAPPPAGFANQQDGAAWCREYETNVLAPRPGNLVGAGSNVFDCLNVFDPSVGLVAAGGCTTGTVPLIGMFVNCHNIMDMR